MSDDKAIPTLPVNADNPAYVPATASTGYVPTRGQPPSSGIVGKHVAQEPYKPDVANMNDGKHN